jgi:hypothetical protein
MSGIAKSNSLFVEALIPQKRIATRDWPEKSRHMPRIRIHLENFAAGNHTSTMERL